MTLRLLQVDGNDSTSSLDTAISVETAHATQRRNVRALLIFPKATAVTPWAVAFAGFSYGFP